MAEFDADALQEFQEFLRFKKMREATSGSYVETEVPTSRPARREPGISELVTRWYETNERYKTALQQAEQLKHVADELAEELAIDYGVDVIGMSKREVRAPEDRRMTGPRRQRAPKPDPEPWPEEEDPEYEERVDYSPPIQRATAGEIPGEVLPESAVVPAEMAGVITVKTKSVSVGGDGSKEQDFARGVAASLQQAANLLK